MPILMETGGEPIFEEKRPRKQLPGLATFLLPNSGPTAMPGLGDGPFREPPGVIPLPTTAAMWFLILLLPPFRRPRRQRAMVTA
jgi:hypothetical protein